MERRRRRIEKRVSVYDREFKFVLLGERQVGKTALAKRFTSDNFDSGVSATLGIEYFTRIVTSRNRQIKIKIWDISAVNSFRSISPNFFHKADGIVIVYDITRRFSFLRVPDWLARAREWSLPHAVIFIMGAKNDLEENREVTFEQANLFSRSFQLMNFETSARLGTDVGSSFSVMLEVLELQQRPLGDPNVVIQGRQPHVVVPGCCCRPPVQLPSQSLSMPVMPPRPVYFDPPPQPYLNMNTSSLGLESNPVVPSAVQQTPESPGELHIVPEEKTVQIEEDKQSSSQHVLGAEKERDIEGGERKIGERGERQGELDRKKEEEEKEKEEEEEKEKEEEEEKEKEVKEKEEEMR